MYETDEDLEALQHLLDTSWDTAGAHLQAVITPERRLTARQLSERLQGMCLLTLATVTSDGRPIAAPVDGFFYRGTFWFGSSPDSLRFRHIARNPNVSVAYVPAEELSVTMHGRADLVDLADPEHAGFSRLCTDFYGPGWSEWGEGAAYARIEPAKVFTFFLAPGSEASPSDS